MLLKKTKTFRYKLLKLESLYFFNEFSIFSKQQNDILTQCKDDDLCIEEA